MEKSTAPLEENKSGITRREVLGFAWLLGLGALAAKTAGLLFDFSLPRVRKGEYGSVIDVGAISGLPAAGEAPLNHPRGKFWLVNTEAGLQAFYKACTHLDCLFEWSAQEERFICPCHGSMFEKDGTCLNGPANRSLDQFVIQVVSRKGELLAESAPDSGKPLAVYRQDSGQEAVKGAIPGGIPVPGDAIVKVDTSRKITGKTRRS